MDDADDLGQAVAGFRRAEVALAAIAADADRLVEARSEVEQARDELKVVAGALVGLASAHRDLVGQLGDAAAALRPAKREDDDRLVVALREAEDSRARQVAEVADAVEELARRLDRALAERIGGVVAELSARLPSAEQVAAVADRLDGLARADRLAALAEQLDELPSAAQLAALADRLDQLDVLATSAELEKVAESVGGLARADQVEALAESVGGLARMDQVEALAEVVDRLAQADRQGLNDRLDAIGRLLSAEQMAAISDLLAALPTATHLARLEVTATSNDLERVAESVGGLARMDQVEALAERVDRLAQADRQGLNDRLDAIGRLPSAEQMAAISDLLAGLPTATHLARLEVTATSTDLERVAESVGGLARMDQVEALERRMVEALSSQADAQPAADVAEQAARKAVVDDQVSRLLEEVKVSQQRVQVLVLAVGLSFLLFAALVSVLALL